MGDESVVKFGEWAAPNPKDIGYLDQHYKNLDREKSAVEIISEVSPSWSHAEVRKHLNDFLFRKNEEANALVKNLSGGEKARLSLAKIAANPPKLLILDEITNNVDLETRDHIVEVLRDYPAAMVIVSHDELFLYEIGVEKWHIKQ
jgi:ATPase subunit of ABC transporter with duplicated ATPase domains